MSNPFKGWKEAKLGDEVKSQEVHLVAKEFY
jgi:hypothetical protein